MPHQMLYNQSLKYITQGQIFFSGWLLIHDRERGNYSKRLSRGNGICLWIVFLPLRRLFETPLKTCPLLRLTESQNTSCHGRVPARGSWAWTNAWGFRSDLAAASPKWWHKLKHLRNLGLGLVEHGSSWKFLNVWATGSSTLPQFLYLHLGKASGWQKWAQLVSKVRCHRQLSVPFLLFLLRCKSFTFKIEKFSIVSMWTSTNWKGQISCFSFPLCNL